MYVPEEPEKECEGLAVPEEERDPDIEGRFYTILHSARHFPIAVRILLTGARILPRASLSASRCCKLILARVSQDDGCMGSCWTGGNLSMPRDVDNGSAVAGRL